MVRVIDIDDSGLSVSDVLESIRSPDGAILRRGGRVIAQLFAADETDLEDEKWAHAPEQLARGDAARERRGKRQTQSHDDVKRDLDE